MYKDRRDYDSKGGYYVFHRYGIVIEGKAEINGEVLETRDAFKVEKEDIQLRDKEGKVKGLRKEIKRHKKSGRNFYHFEYSKLYIIIQFRSLKLEDLYHLE